MEVVHVEGEDRGHVMLYALSTCGWCKKTKELLNELGVEYHYVDVDRTQGEERENLLEEVEKWNPRRSFPTIVINGRTSILGFDEVRIRKELGM